MERLRGLVLTAALVALAGAPAQAAPEAASPALEAADAAVTAAVERAAKSVVSVEVDVTRYGPRRLTAAERAALGVGAAYDPRYFAAPEGPVAGVVVGPGLIATATSALEGDGNVTVVSPSGKRYPARRVGRDDNVAVSLLAVEGAGGDLIPIQPAGGPPRIAQTLLLIARTQVENRPLVTRGIVAGLGRERGDAFTHSARTSFANTGGALVDLEGHLLGISVRHAARVPQGQASGVGYGAAWTRFRENVPQMARGEVIAARPTAFLGIGIDPSYTDLGVRVREVIEGTGAKEAGITAGDVIRIFNQVEIKHFAQLVEEIQKLEVGTEIVVTVKRKDEELDFRVKLGERPEQR